MAALTFLRSSLPTTKLGYRILISMNRFKIAISSSFAAQ